MFYILVGLLTGFWIWSQRPGLAIDRVFPSQPLIFARLANVEKHVNQWVNSDFGKNIAAIDLPEVLSRNNFSSKDVSDLKHWQENLAGFWNNPLIKKFLSKEVAVGVWREDDSYQVLFALRLTFSTRIAELLGQLSHHWGDDITITQERYRGRTINHIFLKKQGMGVAYVRVRDLLILTPESFGDLQQVVDVYQHKRLALRDDPSFDLVRRNSYPSSDGLAYINFAYSSSLWRGEMDAKLNMFGYKAEAFPVYGFSYKPGAISKYKIMVGLDKKYMPGDMQKMLSCPALANDTMKLVPADAILYSWGGCYDFEQSWDAAKKRLALDPELDQTVGLLKHKLERHFKFSIKKDLLPVLGHEIGGYLTDVDMQGKYPFPRLLVFVKIKDRAKAEDILSRLAQNPFAPLQNEEYEHVPIHYFPLSMGTNMDPGYGFLGDYLLVATSRQLIKRSIDAYNDSLSSIVSDNAIEQLGLGVGSKFHSVTLMKTAELSRRAQDFLGWADKYLSGQVSMAAAYKQDGNNKKHELDEAIADKSAELVLARKKLTQLKTTSLSVVNLEDPGAVGGAIANLSREEDILRDDIAHYTQQKTELARLLDNYMLGAQSAKLTMYNMDNVVSLVLKGLESINAQSVTVRFEDKMLETEFLVK